MPHQKRNPPVKTSRIAALCFVFAAAPLTAGEFGAPVLSDLDGDGVDERFVMLDDDDGIVDLRIDHANGVTLARDIAWIGGIGQEPELALAPNGSVQVVSMNESIGRSRWRMTLTIAYRRDAYRVAGFTFDWYDTLDVTDNGTCDLNLLNGRGYLSVNGGARQSVRTDQAALPVTEWKDDHPIPAACQRPN